MLIPILPSKDRFLTAFTMAGADEICQQQIQLRPPATINESPIPEHYEFLKTPVPQRKYRINFRHPAYPSDDNILFTLYAWDHAEGGIHHGFAHNACAIFADNRFDGYLSTSCNSEHGERITAGWDDVLPASSGDYYFYIPYSSDADSSEVLDASSRPPYRWPVVPTFQHWRFPSVLPEMWLRCVPIQSGVSNTSPQSTLTAAIHQRDITCRVTAFESGTEVAHLIPEHEKQWFLANSMATWNSDLTLDPNNLLRDLSNAVLLRSDMHTAFDRRKFVFFPKNPESFVLHMLEPTSDIGQLYHNTRLQIPHCSVEFLLARFAWSIFPSLSGFLSKPARSRLIVRVKADAGKQVMSEVIDGIALGKIAAASRSNSPTKRSRMAAEFDEVDHVLKHARTGTGFSIRSTPPSLEDDAEAEPTPRPSENRTMHDVLTSCHPDYAETGDEGQETSYIEDLRQNALAQQRPEGYNPQRLPYCRHRPAKDELELMGVEILQNSDDNDLYL